MGHLKAKQNLIKGDYKMKTKMTKIMSLVAASAIVLSACGNTSDTDSSNQNRENIEVNTEGYPIVDETLDRKSVV